MWDSEKPHGDKPIKYVAVIYSSLHYERSALWNKISWEIHQVEYTLEGNHARNFKSALHSSDYEIMQVRRKTNLTCIIDMTNNVCVQYFITGIQLQNVQLGYL